MELTLDHLPAKLRQKVNILTILTKHHKLEKLRQLRGESKDLIIEIYHHSAGTDSYYCDVNKCYLTWSALLTKSKAFIETGANLFTAVIEYKKGIHFISSKTDPIPNLN